jgi:hypothetical protein
MIVLVACERDAKQSAPESVQPDPWQAKPAPSPVLPAPKQILATLAGFTDEVCKCVDNDCLERVTDARNKYTHELAPHARDAFKDYAEGIAAAEEQQRRFAECAQRILKPEPGRLSTSQKKIARYIELRDEMCGCTDGPCVERVQRDIDRHSDETKHVPFASDDDARRMAQAMKESVACSVKVSSKR